MPNARELALLIWFALLALWILAQSQRRSSVAALLRAATDRKILTPLAAMVAWVSGEVWLATMVVGWNSELTKGAVVWFITAGIVLFAQFGEAAKNPHYLRQKALETLAWSSFIEFYLDLHHFPLAVEIILLPLLAMLTMIAVFAARRKEHRHAKACAEWLLALAGLAIFAYITNQTIRSWGSIDRRGLLIEFMLSVWLTIGALPFIFFLALYAGCEAVFVRLRLVEDISQRQRWQSTLAILVALRFRLRDLSDITGYWLRKIAHAPTFRDAFTVVRNYRADRRRVELRIAEEKQRLAQYAGVDGVDAGGRQLDRREFKETTAALRWLSTCMMGWYAKGNLYRPDMLKILEGDFTRHGLKGPHGVELRVSSDGQSWYAWRRAVTGWCFAIGAAGPPTQEWQYDGASPPSGFPGTDGSWGPSPLSSESSTNW